MKKEVKKFLESKEKQNNATPVAIEDIWSGKVRKVVHCDKEWQSEVLRSINYKIMKDLKRSPRHLTDMHYDEFGKDTCYGFSFSYGDIDFWKKQKYEVVEFNDVDMSKYITNDDIKRIKKYYGKFDELTTY